MIYRVVLTSLFALSAVSTSAEEINFAGLDADASGALSLEEVQAVAPNVTAEEFASYDTDASGDLSEDEFTAWTTPSSEEPAPQ